MLKNQNVVYKRSRTMVIGSALLAASIGLILSQQTVAAVVADLGAVKSAYGGADEDDEKAVLISPEALAAGSGALGAPLLGDPNNLLYPLNQGTWTLVDFFGDGNECGGSGAAGGPDQHNDDDSARVDLPFTFTLYGTPFTTVWVNNNGNLTFDGCLATFTPFGFPIAGNAMVAPFFADVDTGNPSNFVGDVWQQLLDSDNSGSVDTFIVTWDNVGYYNENGDLRNTFQVAISDGTNPTMGIGTNVCFSYADMQWTTGDASGGVGGFGGFSNDEGPATVGANAGDGVTAFFIGRFDEPGGAPPDPINGEPGGIDWLDDRDICFNGSGENICPIPLDFPPGNQVDVESPTVIDLTVSFTSPEFDQTTSVVITDTDGAQAAGLVITNTPGQTATVDLDWSTECQDQGTYTLTLEATDDGTPPCTTTEVLTITVTCPTVSCTVDLIADGGSDETAVVVGTVTTEFNDDGTWTVSYATTGSWMLQSTKFHAGCGLEDFPLTRNGNPKVGQFDYKAEHDPLVQTFSFIVDAQDCDCVLFAAHAEVCDPDNEREESAWGAGESFPGNNWATYFECGDCDN